MSVGEMHYPGYSGFVAFSRAGCRTNRDLIFIYPGYGGRFNVHVNISGLHRAHGRRRVSRGTGRGNMNSVIIVRGMFTCGRIVPLRVNSGIVKECVGGDNVGYPVRAMSPDMSVGRYMVGMDHSGGKGLGCILHSNPDCANAFMSGRVLNSHRHHIVRSNALFAVKTADVVLHATSDRRRWQRGGGLGWGRKLR